MAQPFRSRADSGPGVPATLQTLIPARLDRLPWCRFHWIVVIALGITWILDGLEVTLTGAVGGILQSPETLHFTSEEIGLIASWYLTGAVVGALFFGYLTDRLGRKKLFFITLCVYLGGTLLTGFSGGFWSFAACRFVTGAGIGGEYAAINSAIDELIPARIRGQVDLLINGSYWIGAALGSVATLYFLDPRFFPVNIGWRVSFIVGAVIGLGILLFRRAVPESPRWLITHGHAAEAERVVGDIERIVADTCGADLGMPSREETLTIHPQSHFGFAIIARLMFGAYRTRAVLGLALMASQAFLYNAIFFTYALVLTRFYDIPADRTGIYLLPFAIGNFLGPALLGRLFDTVGRRAMIAATYAFSAVLLAVTGVLFSQGLLTAAGQTALWTLIFFIASPAASAAYLTVGEIFPLEMRAMAIAFFFALGTGVGGVLAPWLFGTLIGTGSRDHLMLGYVAAAALMLAAALVEIAYGVDAERTALEKVAAPLSAVK
ncbi:MAG TPA: MFS transporter [Candidatus Baltobacteraceae bacterium]|nr:MFS transporter [Candidatus Baltobacteraceae bacterium]